MALTRSEVQKVALLGRLLLTEEELARMTAQLDAIVAYVHQLEEIDTRNVEPMAHAADLTNVFAEDVLAASLDREQALANAPKRDESCYRVPAVLGD